MASCSKCGASLVTQARFCAACGSPVARVSAAPNQGISLRGAADPYGKTVRHEDPESDAVPAPAVLSPLAASVMASSPATVPPAPPPPAPPAPPQASQRIPAQPPAPAPLAQPRAEPFYSFAPGTLVLVHWADGNRYPGTVLQVSGSHVFVAFPNGAQQWIDARYVTGGP